MTAIDQRNAQPTTVTPLAGTTVHAVDPLVIELHGGDTVVSTPRAKTRARVGKSALELLLAASASDGARVGEPYGAAEPAADDIVRQLLGAGLLLRHAPDRDLPDPWNAWGLQAWAYHNRVRDIRFQTPAERAAHVEAIDPGTMPATRHRRTSDRTLMLPRVRVDFTESFREVLEGRRTHRDFADQTLDLDRFSTVLHYAFGPIRFSNSLNYGYLQLRAAASGGARHETEAFVGVLNVEGIAPGLYHYDNELHALTPVDDGVDRDTFEHLTYGQGWHAQCAFGVLTAAFAERMSWKYETPRAYKYLFHNAGHAAQTFAMVCTGLGLGAALTGAIRDSEANTLLGLNGQSEFATFSLACGLPVLGDTGLPRRLRLGRPAPLDQPASD